MDQGLKTKTNYPTEAKKTDIICIGHITHDRIVTPDREVHMPGGTSFYFSYGIRHLLGERDDISYRLITSLSEKDMKAVNDMRREGIEVDVIPSRETVYFENIYDANQNNRRQRVRAKADPFSCEKLGDVNARKRRLVKGSADARKHGGEGRCGKDSDPSPLRRTRPDRVSWRKLRTVRRAFSRPSRLRRALMRSWL